MSAKNQSTTQKVVLIGIAVFALLIFTVTDDMIQSARRLFQGQRAEDEYPSFALASGDRVIVDPDTLRSYAGLLGLFGGRPTQEDLYQFIMTYRLALESGIHVTESELSEFVSDPMWGLKTPEDYRVFIQSRGIRMRDWEEALRRHLVVEHYTRAFTDALGTPSPDQLLEAFGEQAEEFRVAAVAIALESHSPDDPGDEVLSAAWDELDVESRALRYPSPEMAALEAWIVDPAAAPTDAFAAMMIEPDEAWAPSEDDITNFFADVRAVRFDAEEDGAVAPELHEVREAVEHEFRLRRAMERIRTDAAADGIEDGAAFAASYGLVHLPGGDPRNQSDLSTDPQIGTGRLALRAFATETGSFSSMVEAVPAGYVIYRVTDHVDAGAMPFSEARADFLESWQAEQGRTAAEAAATALFEAAGGEGGLAGAAEAAGLTTEAYEWISLDAQRDPYYVNMEDGLERWTRGNLAALAAMEDGAVGVADAVFDPAARRWVVMESLERRKPTVDDMRPLDRQNALRTAIGKAQQAVFDDMLSYDALARLHDLRFPGREPDPDATDDDTDT